MATEPPPSVPCASSSSLISQNPSTSGLKIGLHPLALLSISDYITRHTLRQIKGPIVGALLGNQEGREIAIEQAYEVKLAKNVGQDGDNEIRIDEDWFDKKLRLFKDTNPTMDLLGWFSTTTDPNFHPSREHVACHLALQKYNESLVLLLLNPYSAGASVGGKLPLGIFESVLEGGEAGSEGGNANLKFVPTKYTIETGEAEMIGVDFIAKGGWGNAGAGSSSAGKAAGVGAGDAAHGGEAGAKDGKSEDVVMSQSSDFIGTQNDELLANLTAKANAIRMLHSRVRLLRTYLESLPQSQATNPTAETLPISHTLLRSIKALTHSRLPLLIPSDYAAYQQESLAEQSDVSLVALLGTLTRSVEELKEVGRKFMIVDTAVQRESHLANVQMGGGGGPGRGKLEGGGGGGGGGGGNGPSGGGGGGGGGGSGIGSTFGEKLMDMGRLVRGAGGGASSRFPS
ncbi:hypothetical protein DFH27DRAFT_507586 [Peziza echinospora]|nr:hypothetical protein DFH27DRAFT_507586 [Peziza echinospora]